MLFFSFSLSLSFFLSLSLCLSKYLCLSLCLSPCLCLYRFLSLLFFLSFFFGAVLWTVCHCKKYRVLLTSCIGHVFIEKFKVDLNLKYIEVHT